MRKAGIEDKELVSDILVSAFLPLKGRNSINLVVKQDKRRLERMKVLMDYLFERSMRFGEIFVSNNDQACILLLFPHEEKISLRTILLDIELAFKCIGIFRVYQVLKRQKVASKYYPKGKHIKPVIMGVKNERKGNGTAARLMLKVRNEFKNNSWPVIVDAASISNAKLYQKFGFKIINKEEALGFPIYFLRLN